MEYAGFLSHNGSAGWARARDISILHGSQSDTAMGTPLRTQGINISAMLLLFDRTLCFAHRRGREHAAELPEQGHPTASQLPHKAVD